MTTRKQQEANRRNAGRSTGPRTSTGKAASARNARRHGFYAAPDAAELEAMYRIIMGDEAARPDPSCLGSRELAALALAEAEVRLAWLRRAEAARLRELESELAHCLHDNRALLLARLQEMVWHDKERAAAQFREAFGPEPSERAQTLQRELVTIAGHRRRLVGRRRRAFRRWYQLDQSQCDGLQTRSKE